MHRVKPAAVLLFFGVTFDLQAEEGLSLPQERKDERKQDKNGGTLKVTGLDPYQILCATCTYCSYHIMKIVEVATFVCLLYLCDYSMKV